MVSEARVGPSVLGEDLLQGAACLEPTGRWTPRAWERHTQVGLQLGLQVLEKGGTKVPLRQLPGQPRRPEPAMARTGPGFQVDSCPFLSLRGQSQGDDQSRSPKSATP